ncbi:Dynein light chain 1, cytoplasmic [Intoshia linei]|uniref:Dynein light chain 1, cytoplasmic n=1 Tax=Intoshia linei TaxID=1819745 RepID=A0A177BBQ6_9BILA|nr:Dynein light chain 1, cytoplasmic [Intoshia linei]
MSNSEDDGWEYLSDVETQHFPNNGFANTNNNYLVQKKCYENFVSSESLNSDLIEWKDSEEDLTSQNRKNVFNIKDEKHKSRVSQLLNMQKYMHIKKFNRVVELDSFDMMNNLNNDPRMVNSCINILRNDFGTFDFNLPNSNVVFMKKCSKITELSNFENLDHNSVRSTEDEYEFVDSSIFNELKKGEKFCTEVSLITKRFDKLIQDNNVVVRRFNTVKSLLGKVINNFKSDGKINLTKIPKAPIYCLSLLAFFLTFSIFWSFFDNSSNSISRIYLDDLNAINMAIHKKEMKKATERIAKLSILFQSAVIESNNFKMNIKKLTMENNYLKSALEESRHPKSLPNSFSKLASVENIISEPETGRVEPLSSLYHQILLNVEKKLTNESLETDNDEFFFRLSMFDKITNKFTEIFKQYFEMSISVIHDERKFNRNIYRKFTQWVEETQNTFFKESLIGYQKSGFGKNYSNVKRLEVVKESDESKFHIFGQFCKNIVNNVKKPLINSVRNSISDVANVINDGIHSTGQLMNKLLSLSSFDQRKLDPWAHVEICNDDEFLDDWLTNDLESEKNKCNEMYKSKHAHYNRKLHSFNDPPEGQDENFGTFLRNAKVLYVRERLGCIIIMAERHVIFKNVDMPEDMQQEVVEVATTALEKFNVEKDIATYIKREFDKKYNPTWHCVVGRNFGSYCTHEAKNFIYFYLGQVAILLFKSG